jgi:hypothetical protein
MSGQANNSGRVDTDLEKFRHPSVRGVTAPRLRFQFPHSEERGFELVEELKSLIPVQRPARRWRSPGPGSLDDG